jgi:hypothetical protein
MDPSARTARRHVPHRWRAVYVHPDKPNVEVTLKTSDTTEPAPRRMFLIAGGPTLLHLKSAEPINNSNTKESDVHMATRQARKRPKKSGTRRAPQAEPEVDEELDGLDDLDVDDLDDEEEEIEDDDELDEEDDIEDEEEDEEIEEDEDDLDDLDDLDEDENEEIEDEEEPEPAPRKRSSGRKAASSGRTRAPVKSAAPADGDKPLTDAQAKMLKASAKNKTGAKVENIGQRRTAEALIGRGLVKYVPRTDKTRVAATAAGKKYDPSVTGTATKAAPAKKSSSKRASASKSTGNGVPKGMVGVAKIADVAKVHEETVRRVLRMNEDRWAKDEEAGRYLFTKDEAREVIREVKAYTKYTGGSRGRPVGARTELPEGKVGPQWIADEAGVHRNTVYKFLRKHEERFERYISEDGLLWVFPESVATKIVAKLGG